MEHNHSLIHPCVCTFSFCLHLVWIGSHSLSWVFSYSWILVQMQWPGSLVCGSVLRWASSDTVWFIWNIVFWSFFLLSSLVRITWHSSSFTVSKLMLSNVMCMQRHSDTFMHHTPIPTNTCWHTTHIHILHTCIIHKFTPHLLNTRVQHILLRNHVPHNDL